MKKSFTALAFGTFGLGITEFVMMGILPYAAKDLGISIPTAGHLISAYALGVCTGAPLLVLFAHTWPLKRMLILLMSLYTVAAFTTVIAPSYATVFVARFISGLPHGAYFGVGSIVADRLSPKGKSALAVALMSSGMTFANLIGIPVGTFLSTYSWRLVFALSGVWGLITLFSIIKWIPYMEPLANTSFKGQFKFLKSPAPWLIIGATLLGNGGIFCWYSYINPLLTTVSGVPASYISLMMVLAGGGMVCGNLLGGRFADKFGPGHTGRAFEICIFVLLSCIFLFSHITIVSIVLMCLTTLCLFAVSAPQQILLLRYSKGGELLGGAMVQLAFNFGNATGAFCGGLPVAAGRGYEWTALVGACFALLGIICYVTFCHKYERNIAMSK